MKEKKIIFSKQIKIIVILISLFIINNNVIADDRGYDYGGNFNSIGGGSAVSCTYDACQSMKISDFQFRITLIDKDGKIVDGTHSVDYGYNELDTKTQKLTGNDLTNKINGLANYNRSTGDYSYGYKYETLYPSQNKGNIFNNNTYSYYKVKLASRDYNFRNEYSNFIYDFENIIKTKTKKFGIEAGTTGDYDFLTMFLYHNGYLQSTDGNYYALDDPSGHWNDEISKLNEYYLLVEPMFNVYKPGSFYLNDTAYNIVNYIGTSNIPYNLTGDTTKLFFTGAYSKKSSLPDFMRIDNPIDENQVSIDRGLNATAKWKKILLTNEGYGINVLSINTIPLPLPTTTSTKLNFEKEYCNETINGSNNGKIIFKMTNDLSETLYEDSIHTGFAYKKYNSSNSEIYCYDDVTYDFSDMMDALNRTTAKPTTNIDISPGTVTVKRHCMVYAPESEYTTAKTTFMNNFNEYETQNIPLNIYGKTINLKKTDIETTVDTSNLKTILGNKKGIYNVTAAITFGYTENESKVYVEKNYGDGTASIDLSNVTFGYSNDLKNQVQDGQTYTYGNYTFNTHVISNTENYVCGFKTPVETPNITTTTVTKEKYTTPDIQFRTIDLDNPFPARDGSSRLPGTNWLGKDNYVRTYITYNRGVKGNEVYNKEPIYTITLTPSSMIKIREYNKKINNYSDINDELVCTGENNTSCLSPFLADSRLIERENKDGSCALKNIDGEGLTFRSDPNGIKNSNSNILVDNITEIYDNNKSVFLYNYSDAQLELDFNKDKILTLRDTYIYDAAEKTTSFYTCADKTYENSGYIRKEQ